MAQAEGYPATNFTKIAGAIHESSLPKFGQGNCPARKGRDRGATPIPAYEEFSPAEGGCSPDGHVRAWLAGFTRRFISRPQDLS